MIFYDKLKDKYKKEFSETAHFLNLFNVLLNMFSWENLPDTIFQEQLEGILISNGTVGIGEIDGNLYCGFGSYFGDVRGFLPEEYQFAVQGLGNVSGKWDKSGTVSVGWNNATFTPDIILAQYSSILTEIDVSERLNVIFARLLKIPKVHDQKEKTAIENSINALLDGKINAFVSNNIQDARLLLQDGLNRDDNFLDISDVDKIDKLQYLNQYRDNVIKRFFQIYGISTQVTGKLAQQSADEIHSNDDVSLTLFYSRFKYRQKLCDDINSKFGLNVSVSINPAWIDSISETMTGTDGGVENENLQSETGTTGAETDVTVTDNI